MIITQEQAVLQSQKQLQSVLDFIEQSASDRKQRIDQVEREVFSQLLAICDGQDLGLAVLALATVSASKTGANAQTADFSNP